MSIVSRSTMYSKKHKENPFGWGNFLWESSSLGYRLTNVVCFNFIIMIFSYNNTTRIFAMAMSLVHSLGVQILRRSRTTVQITKIITYSYAILTINFKSIQTFSNSLKWFTAFYTISLNFGCILFIECIAIDSQHWKY